MGHRSAGLHVRDQSEPAEKLTRSASQTHAGEEGTEMKRIDFHRAPCCPGPPLSRRGFLKKSAALTASSLALNAGCSSAGEAKQASEAEKTPPHGEPTSIALCKHYRMKEVRSALATMLDHLGGVRKLVKRKHVTIKVNLVNTSHETLGGVPLPLTVTTHPVVAEALGSLLIEYGARKIAFCDQLPFRCAPEEAFAGYGFDIKRFSQSMDGNVRFLNTRNRGTHKDYAFVKTPGREEIASAWEVHQVYAKTDVLVSIGKLKSHVSAGITGGMKNLFGVPPSSLYGNDAPDRPNEKAIGYRNDTMHTCTRKPLTSVDTYTGAWVEGDHGYNVPRLIVDLNAAFPIDLAVLDCISTIQTAEGWWLGSMVSVIRPGVLIAGRNAVCTDAVGAAVMGFNPDAGDRTHPFANGTNYLALARRKGLGENRIDRIPILGEKLAEAECAFQPTYQRSSKS